MTRYLFVTGGVVSSLGKGIAAASLAALFEARGLNVVLQKLDPYINVDPGTMSPYQHGEVFVTEDGAETDLDLGHYERFTRTNTSKRSNYTTGRIYNAVISRERRGDYDGGTVQVIPHITDEIRRAIRSVAKDNTDIAIIEIGGTVGDIESLPFLEAIRQMRGDLGFKRTAFMHLTLVPYIKAAKEIKTKPTQHSVQKLRELGIQADVLVCRCEAEYPLSDSERLKIARFCNVKEHAVVNAIDADTIYRVPLYLHAGNLDTVLLDHFELENIKPDLSKWQEICDIIHENNSATEPYVRIAIIGKYTELADAYKSLDEALLHATIAHRIKVELQYIDANALQENIAQLDNYNAILVPGGFGSRGMQGKLAAIRYAREHNVPFFGICLGMQLAVIEYARNVAGLPQATGSEFDPERDSEIRVIDLMTGWEDQGTRVARSFDDDRGGTLRLGSYACQIHPDTHAFAAYGKDEIHERHRHRYEVNNKYRQVLEDAGLIISGTLPDNSLVEMIEAPNHPWFVACQFHPEFKSRAYEPHPLFSAFIAAALQYRDK
ncbi:MAG: CTP synthase [Mariprofundales bacterium]